MGRHACAETALDAVAAVQRRLAEWAAIAPGGGPEYLSAGHNAANLLVAQWMAEAGLAVAEDGLGNVIGRHSGAAGAPRLVLGAHLGYVGAPQPDAVLGLAVAIEAVGRLGAAGPDSGGIGIIALADPGGARFGQPGLAAAASCGAFQPQWLELEDLDGIPLREAATAFAVDPDEFTKDRPAPEAFLFVDIDAQLRHAVSGHTLGVGLLIAARRTVEVEVVGDPAAPGTPARYRRDAVAAVAELIAVAEQLGAAGAGRITVSDLESCPPAGMVPARARFVVDLAERTDAALAASWQQLLHRWQQVTHRRGVRLSASVQAHLPMADCADWLTAATVDAIAAAGHEPVRLAGYDQADVSAFAGRCDVGWLALAGLGAAELGAGARTGVPDRDDADRIRAAVTVLAGALLRAGAALRTAVPNTAVPGTAVPAGSGVLPAPRSGTRSVGSADHRVDGPPGKHVAAAPHRYGPPPGNPAATADPAPSELAAPSLASHQAGMSIGSTNGSHRIR